MFEGSAKHRFTATLSIATDDGNFLASFTRRGLARLMFPSEKGDLGISDHSTGGTIPDNWEMLLQTALRQALSGMRPEKMPPFDLSVGTDFQRSVWEVLAAIPSGRTMSYGEVARALGCPNAVRAVGQACGANPVPVLIPCHRVLAAHQKLGGFSGGLPWKTKLLEREGCFLEKQLSFLEIER